MPAQGHLDWAGSKGPAQLLAGKQAEAAECLVTAEQYGGRVCKSHVGSMEQPHKELMQLGSSYAKVQVPATAARHTAACRRHLSKSQGGTTFQP